MELTYGETRMEDSRAEEHADVLEYFVQVLGKLLSQSYVQRWIAADISYHVRADSLVHRYRVSCNIQVIFSPTE
jgi:hypothetical protein